MRNSIDIESAVSVVRAAHEHRLVIRHNTAQSFATSIGVLSLVSLMGLWFVTQQKVVTVSPIRTDWILVPIHPVEEHIPVAPKPEVMRIHDVSSASRVLAVHDTVIPMLQEPQQLSSVNLSSISSNTNVASTGATSLQGSNTQGGGLNTQPSDKVPSDVDFSVPPEVEATVNLADVQANIVYPPRMIRLGASGSVTVLVSIDEMGRAHSASVLESTDQGFNEAAVKAVMACHYTAARNGNQPVASMLAIPIRFHLH